MFCPKCRNKVPNVAKFCDVCGTPIVDERVVTRRKMTDYDYTEPEYRKKTSKKGIIFILLGVIIIIVSSVFAFLYLNKNKEEKEDGSVQVIEIQWNMESEDVKSHMEEIESEKKGTFDDDNKNYLCYSVANVENVGYMDIKCGFSDDELCAVKGYGNKEKLKSIIEEKYGNGKENGKGVVYWEEDNTFIKIDGNGIVAFDTDNKANKEEYNKVKEKLK